MRSISSGWFVHLVHNCRVPSQELIGILASFVEVHQASERSDSFRNRQVDQEHQQCGDVGQGRVDDYRMARLDHLDFDERIDAVKVS
jgi:hypothetical protein